MLSISDKPHCDHNNFPTSSVTPLIYGCLTHFLLLYFLLCGSKTCYRNFLKLLQVKLGSPDSFRVDKQPDFIFSKSAMCFGNTSTVRHQGLKYVKGPPVWDQEETQIWEGCIRKGICHKKLGLFAIAKKCQTEGDIFKFLKAKSQHFSFQQKNICHLFIILVTDLDLSHGGSSLNKTTQVF